MILPKVRDPRFVTIVAVGPSLIRITISSLCGLRRARSTSLTCSSRLSPMTHDHVKRSSTLAPGCVVRSR